MENTASSYIKEEIKMTTTATKEYTIRDIETLTEAQAAEMAIEAATVKGHQVYFVTLAAISAIPCLCSLMGIISSMPMITSYTTQEKAATNCGNFTLTA